MPKKTTAKFKAADRNPYSWNVVIRKGDYQ